MTRFYLISLPSLRQSRREGRPAKRRRGESRGACRGMPTMLRQAQHDTSTFLPPFPSRQQISFGWKQVEHGEPVRLQGHNSPSGNWALCDKHLFALYSIEIASCPVIRRFIYFISFKCSHAFGKSCHKYVTLPKNHPNYQFLISTE